MDQQAGKPTLLAFTPRRPKTNGECVSEEFRKIAATVTGVVILYQQADGSYMTMSDQGDDAGTVYFIEKAKLSLLSSADPRPEVVG